MLVSNVASPLTLRLESVPTLVMLPWAAVVKVPAILPNVTLSVVPTAWPMEISPPDIPTPVPALKWALVSAAEGPV